jgi:hypothetical protein
MTGKNPGKISLTLTQNGKTYKIKERKSGQLRKNGQQANYRQKSASPAPIWYYDDDKKCVVIDFMWDGKPLEISLK